MAKILGFVRRVENKERIAEFYRLLGLDLLEHEHGGPEHYEVGPVSSNFVFEVYKNSGRFLGDAIMIGVDDLKEAINRLQQNSVAITYLANKNYVYVKDPDGADVMLVQL